MLNFRKLKQEFSQNLLREGRTLLHEGAVFSAKILEFSSQTIRWQCRVSGNYDNSYCCELEVTRASSELTDSDCDCAHRYDCVHLAASLLYLEEHSNRLVIDYSKEHDLSSEVAEGASEDSEENLTLLREVEKAKQLQNDKETKKLRRELLEEYLHAARLLGHSSFFVQRVAQEAQSAELAILFSQESVSDLDANKSFLFSIALRLTARSKPISIQNIAEFFKAVVDKEPLYIGSRRYFFTLDSFSSDAAELLTWLISVSVVQNDERSALLVPSDMSLLLAKVSEQVDCSAQFGDDVEPSIAMPYLFFGSLEEPLRTAVGQARLYLELRSLTSPQKLLFTPKVTGMQEEPVALKELRFLNGPKPGLLYQGCYYQFEGRITHNHITEFPLLEQLVIPEPLFGTFIENSLPELRQYMSIGNLALLEKITSLPFVDPLRSECKIDYADGELEAELTFLYGEQRVPSAAAQVEFKHIESFITPEGILARNLSEEQEILEDLFQGFHFDPISGLFSAKTERKIVEFMTEVAPRNQYRVDFIYPEMLLNRFLYDDTAYFLELKEHPSPDRYTLCLNVEGRLTGISIDQLWECIATRRPYIELSTKKTAKVGKRAGGNISDKILILDLERLTPIVQLFDEIGIKELSSHQEQRPLWSLVGLTQERFHQLPIAFSISPSLQKLQQQMGEMGEVSTQENASATAEAKLLKQIHAEIRPYQLQGVQWMARLRSMHLSGILADDMGLGKTLQAIAAITEQKAANPKGQTLVIAPTSLTYNWKEELIKFNPGLRALVVDGLPQQRRRLLGSLKNYDVLITSYSLLQKDVDLYKEHLFDYVILDEAQHIKNRSTRNARSTKELRANYRLILTGTPIENTLEDLWSLFDFLMPGFLSSYDRFVERYIRAQQREEKINHLKRRVAPFILRRMKRDVLKELPPVSEIVYHCHLSEIQKELYTAFASSARKELSALVSREGFERVQIHVLATLTRLKQICCHPALFAKEKAESGDSSKYDMLMELLQTLLEGNHKVVIFSQYTEMLKIIRHDLTARGVRHEYLDGGTKDRMKTVSRFNEDPEIGVFLISLRAGGTGLNLTAADTVIHYDMWWNPAVERQATDRLHRLGQTQNVSVYKLITLNTIEEKILSLQSEKRALDHVVSCDEEAVTMLSWEEVLNLLEMEFEEEEPKRPAARKRSSTALVR